MRGLFGIQVIAAAGAILLARSVVADDWPYYQHDAWHTGNSSALVNPQALSLTWTAPSSPTGYSTPVIVGNSIYAMQNQQGVGNSQTTISSFDLATGAINWSYTGNFVFPSQPGVGGGFVTFVGSTLSSSSLYVLDAITGTLRYTVPIPEGLVSLMPTVVQDLITGNVTAFVTDGIQVSAVSLGSVSGLVLWTQTGEFGGQSIATVVGNSIVLVGPVNITLSIKSLARRTTFGRAGLVVAEAAPLPTTQRASSSTCSKITTQTRRSRPTITLITSILSCCGNALAQALATVAPWQSAQPVTSIPRGTA